MELLLERTTTISEDEKVKIQEQMKMYDPLWDDHPKVKKIREDSKHEGETRALQEVIVDLTKSRFPDLTDLALQRAKQIDSPDVLKFLIVAIGSAVNESEVQVILRSPAA